MKHMLAFIMAGIQSISRMSCMVKREMKYCRNRFCHNRLEEHSKNQINLARAVLVV
jgi:hypothetical protein